MPPYYIKIYLIYNEFMIHLEFPIYYVAFINDEYLIFINELNDRI